jgi:hypothetical protein
MMRGQWVDVLDGIAPDTSVCGRCPCQQARAGLTPAAGRQRLQPLLQDHRRHSGGAIACNVASVPGDDLTCHWYIAGAARRQNPLLRSGLTIGVRDAWTCGRSGRGRFGALDVWSTAPVVAAVAKTGMSRVGAITHAPARSPGRLPGLHSGETSQEQAETAAAVAQARKTSRPVVIPGLTKF